MGVPARGGRAGPAKYFGSELARYRLCFGVYGSPQCERIPDLRRFGLLSRWSHNPGACYPSSHSFVATEVAEDRSRAETVGARLIRPSLTWQPAIIPIFGM